MVSDEEHYLTNYGHCRKEECLCLRGTHPLWPNAWGGLACPDWVPLGARSHDELMMMAREMRRRSREAKP